MKIIMSIKAFTSLLCICALVLAPKRALATFDLEGASLSTLSRLPNTETVLRIKELNTDKPVEQTNVNLQGPFTLYNITVPQDLRRVQLNDSEDHADLRDEGKLIISLGEVTFQEFDLKDKSCSNAVELYQPVGLNGGIVLLITCKGGRVLCLKYSDDKYSIDSIFVSEYTSSTPVIVTHNGISTAVYTIEAEEIFALAIRSLESSGYEQIMYEDTFEDVFGSCVETLSYNETHVRVSCHNTHNFYLVDGSGETDGKEIHPQGVGDLINVYNEDMTLVVGSSFVTINTKESTNFCTLDLPTPVTKVEHAHTNGRLQLLFLSSQGIYKYDSSTSCVNKNLVTIINETLLGLNGDYQNYLIFGELLVYTIVKNGLFSSRGFDMSTSQDLGVFANHQNHPLLYGIIHTSPVTTATPTSSELSTTTSSALSSISGIMVTMTTYFTSPSFPLTSSSAVTMTINTDPSTTSTSLTSSSAVTMTTNPDPRGTSTSIPLLSASLSIFNTMAITTPTPSRTNSDNIQSEPSKFMNSLTFVVGSLLIILMVSCAVVVVLCCCYHYHNHIKKKNSKQPTCNTIQLNNFDQSSNNSSIPQLDTISNDYVTIPTQAEQILSSSVPVNPSGDRNTDKTTTLTSCISIDPIQFSREEEGRVTNDSMV